MFDYQQVLFPDFNIHNGFVGLDHSFSPEYTVSASLGYFTTVNRINNQDGPTYAVSLIRRFSRGSITIGGNGGWSYENLQQGVGLTNSGFSQYYGAYASGRYEILERVNVYAGLSYRHDKYTLDNDDYYRGNAGVRWDFLRYFFVALDYSYVNRREDFGLDEYTDNRIMLSVGAAKPYRW
jgi:uncharacterized protein (PEP-CTERM system associated)